MMMKNKFRKRKRSKNNQKSQRFRNLCSLFRGMDNECSQISGKIATRFLLATCNT